jgi:threonine synthase
MKDIYERLDYTADPHGAVGYLGLKDYLKDHPETYGIFLETAHPVKFLPAVEPVIGKVRELPKQIVGLMGREKVALSIHDYQGFKKSLSYME